MRMQEIWSDPAVWAKALRGREAYWASWAQQLDWETKWDTILEWNPPYAKLGFNPEAHDPPFLKPAVSELAKSDGAD